jgi:hypothetical protein
MLAAALVAYAAHLTAQDRAYRIAGQVVDTSGAPAIGVRVCAYPIERGPSFGASCTRSGNEGSFVLDTRAGGRHARQMAMVGRQHQQRVAARGRERDGHARGDGARQGVDVARPALWMATSRSVECIERLAIAD